MSVGSANSQKSQNFSIKDLTKMRENKEQIQRQSKIDLLKNDLKSMLNQQPVADQSYTASITGIDRFSLGKSINQSNNVGAGNYNVFT